MMDYQISIILIQMIAAIVQSHGKLLKPINKCFALSCNIHKMSHGVVNTLHRKVCTTLGNTNPRFAKICHVPSTSLYPSVRLINELHYMYTSWVQIPLPTVKFCLNKVIILKAWKLNRSQCIAHGDPCKKSLCVIVMYGAIDSLIYGVTEQSYICILSHFYIESPLYWISHCCLCWNLCAVSATEQYSCKTAWACFHRV